MAGEYCEGKEDTGGQENGLENDLGLVEGDDDGDGVGFEKGEAGEEEEVRGVGFALPICEEHETDGAKELELLADCLANYEDEGQLTEAQTAH